MPTVMRRITLTVHGLTQVRFRLWVTTLLLRLAGLVSPMNLILWTEEGEPHLYYCEWCGREFCARAGVGTVTCSRCGHEQAGEP
jgi:hypothetical protein